MGLPVIAEYNGAGRIRNQTFEKFDQKWQAQDLQTALLINTIDNRGIEWGWEDLNPRSRAFRCKYPGHVSYQARPQPLDIIEIRIAYKTYYDNTVNFPKIIV